VAGRRRIIAPMCQICSTISAHYRSELDAAPYSERFNMARASIGALAGKIEQNGLGQRLFGWTSMHDLRIQQLSGDWREALNFALGGGEAVSSS
jgi:hypothetical protein